MEELPEITPPSAPETAPKRKKVIGRPITKETPSSTSSPPPLSRVR